MGETAQLSLGQVHAQAVQQLMEAGKPDADRDAGILLEFVTGHGALSRLTTPDQPLAVDGVDHFFRLVARRIAGEPVHRITGMREFYRLPLALNEATLVPRPDTEVLVDMAIPLLRDMVGRNGSCRILDLGTGTGAIALALLKEVPEATAMGTDIAQRALEAARDNAKTLGLSDRFETQRSDWFSDVSDSFDLIVSNPPYISHAEISALDIEVRDHDPMAALDGGSDGLDAYGVLAARALPFLTGGGHIIVEIGHTQRSAVTAMFEASGLQRVAMAQDLAGHDRALCFTRSKQ